MGVLGSTKLGEEKWSDHNVMYISYMGMLFQQMLKALILPLPLPSLFFHRCSMLPNIYISTGQLPSRFMANMTFMTALVTVSSSATLLVTIDLTVLTSALQGLHFQSEP